MCELSCSVIQLFVIPWTIASQAPLSMEFSRQENWSRLPVPPLGDLAHPGIEPVSLVYPALASWFLIISATWFSYLSISLAWDLILWMVCGSDIVNLFQSGQPIVLASFSKQSILSVLIFQFTSVIYQFSIYEWVFSGFSVPIHWPSYWSFCQKHNIFITMSL